MQTLSKSYLERVVGIQQRRYGLKEGRLFLYGGPSVGKSSLALLHSTTYKKTLYINCFDLRTDIESANALILKSYLERSLELLIIDHYTSQISLPNLAHIILINHSPESCPKDFEKKKIHALSFEEYISLDSKNLSINNLFNLFLKEGNLPEILHLEPSYKITRKQEILRLSLGNDFGIFCALLPMQGQRTSTNHIYTILKKSHKISKDRIYPLLHSLQNRGFIHLVRHLHTQNAKLYFYDFTLPQCVSGEKNFVASLENMLLLELYALLERYKDIAQSICQDGFCEEVKCGLLQNDSVYYGDMGEFVTRLGVFVFLPFATHELIETKLKKLASTQLCAYSEIFIITLSFEGEGIIPRQSPTKTPLAWQALSFISFALEFGFKLRS